MDFTLIIKIIFKLGLFTFFFGLINDMCTTEIEKVKKDGKKTTIKKINFCLLGFYSLMLGLIYMLFVWQVTFVIMSFTCMLGMFGVQNMRPDMLEFMDSLNKNKILKFICKLLISFSLFLGLFYGPLITSVKKNIFPAFTKLTNDFDSDLINKIPDMTKLHKSHISTYISENFSSLDNYLCSTNKDGEEEEEEEERENPITQKIENKIIEEDCNIEQKSEENNDTNNDENKKEN